jgi:hypothetical protein
VLFRSSVLHGKSEDVALILSQKQGVLIVDIIDSTPDVMVVFEGADCFELADYTVRALAAVEKFTSRTVLFPARTKPISAWTCLTVSPVTISNN